MPLQRSSRKTSWLPVSDAFVSLPSTSDYFTGGFQGPIIAKLYSLNHQCQPHEQSAALRVFNHRHLLLQERPTLSPAPHLSRRGGKRMRLYFTACVASKSRAKRAQSLFPETCYSLNMERPAVGNTQVDLFSLASSG